jgi:hypothetical protein
MQRYDLLTKRMFAKSGDKEDTVRYGLEIIARVERHRLPE